MRKTTLILLILVIVFSLCACVGESTDYTEAIKTSTVPKESLTVETDTNQLSGTWATEDALWFFDDNGGLRILYQGYFPGANPENYRTSEDAYNYSVDGDVLSFYSGTQDDADRVYDRLIKFSGNNKLTLTHPVRNEDTVELSRVTDSNGSNNAIIGTWIPFGYDSFEIHLGSVGFGSEELSFYNDGTFRSISHNRSASGEYKFIFDGEVLQMQGQGGRGEIEYQLFGDEFMLLEFSIYNGEMQFSYLLRKEV